MKAYAFDPGKVWNGKTVLPSVAAGMGSGRGELYKNLAKKHVPAEKASKNQPRLDEFGAIPVRELPQKTQRESSQVMVI